MTIDFILSKNIKNAIIFIDSQSVIHAIGNYSPLHCKNELAVFKKEKLYSAHQKDHNIQLNYLDSRPQGNEMADLLAKLAIGQGNLLQIKLPFIDFYSLLQEKSLILLFLG